MSLIKIDMNMSMNTNTLYDGLQDITDEINIDENDTETVSDFYNKKNKITENDIHKIKELIFILIDENQQSFIQPNYKEVLYNEVLDTLYELFTNDEDEDKNENKTDNQAKNQANNQVEDDIQYIEENHIIEEAIEEYFIFHGIPRSIPTYEPILNNEKKEQYKTNIERLKEQNSHEQKTEEWYEKRHTMITASNAWQVLDSDANRNQFIFKKCEKPMIPTNTVNTETTLHWGHKYEPISQQMYEWLYNCKIEEFGCMQHKEYDFLGASPDGIVTDETSNRFGRLLEIKNIVNRKITGEPKKEYWVQMQHQMEVCDLDECDFLECRFKEYENEEEFLKDGDFQKTKDGKYKGIIVHYFHENQPFYVYGPFQMTKSEYDIWLEKTMRENQDKTFIDFIYWYLDEWSIVCVQRNREWFNWALPKYKTIHETIKKERVEGYEHRKPKQRVKKDVKKEEVNVIKLDIL